MFATGNRETTTVRAVRARGVGQWCNVMTATIRGRNQPAFERGGQWQEGSVREWIFEGSADLL